MSNTYSQIFLHIIFAVKGRQSLISKKYSEDIRKYITGIVTNLNCKMIAINNMSDHIHLLIGLNPNISVSDLLEKIKSNSSKWINENRFLSGKFEWQKGYGVFSYSKSQIDNVIKYIENQENHHKKKTFREEYIEFLEKFGVEYNNKYLYEWIE